MGVLLTPIITKDTIALDALHGQTLAVDGNGELYQFLALIRLRDGTPLKDSKGAVRSRYEEERVAALERGDMAAAYSKATMTSRLTKEMVSEARDLLRLMGVPTVQAPSEAEAQAAHMAATSPQVSAAASKDYDALLFGAPTLVRFLTISGKEFLPSQGAFRPIVPETIVLARLLDGWGITREQLVDLALLVGTDFNEGVAGIGPKKALKLVQRYGRIESMPDDIRRAAGDAEVLSDVRRIFLNPEVTDSFSVSASEPDFDGVVRFLCDERDFSRERVTGALDRAFRERSLW